MVRRASKVRERGGGSGVILRLRACLVWRLIEGVLGQHTPRTKMYERWDDHEFREAGDENSLHGDCYNLVGVKCV